MKPSVIGAAATALAATASAQSVDFNSEAVGTPPSGWSCGVTGRGAPKWVIAPDQESKGHVLLQSGSGTFPWCVKNGTAVADGSVETTFKPISGREDRAGGVVWRWKDGDNYYVARANALENNVSLYYTERGSRRTLRYVDAPVASGKWHTLRVEFSGTRIAVALDGKRYIELDDAHISGAGAVGVWTKADSVTAFRSFAYSPSGR
ncbi:MAG TPA: hypothetical protein VFF43_21925 [Caldimonas sp.]|nr:hypothetical protein [Caldimonas sp.]